MARQLISCFLVAMVIAFVTSEPIYPAVALENMDHTDACLFACNICFDSQPPKMMQCVEKVCLTTKANREKGYFWLGKSCVKHPKVSEYVFNTLNDIYA
ncbi:uncharacterized protein LOC135469114 [Liolophura sinensis]|uniref:uncharacterized protein LOC135469114 n=1 Tax=Liolophura sinensis TaxID=3198878 RepID=UPI003159036C